MKMYLSGKIGDLPIDVVREKFMYMKEELESQGHEVISPMELLHQHNQTWADYMIEDLQALKECEAIFLMPCHIDSPGAKIELAFAERMGLLIIKAE